MSQLTVDNILLKSGGGKFELKCFPDTKNMLSGYSRTSPVKG
jgi:hypothetical protein